MLSPVAQAAGEMSQDYNHEKTDVDFGCRCRA